MDISNKPSARTQEIKAQHGVSSMCIGCIFNQEESWPNSMFPVEFDDITLERDYHFPKENHVCKNPDSPKHGNCIIGDPGCGNGRYEK